MVNLAPPRRPHSTTNNQVYLIALFRGKRMSTAGRKTRIIRRVRKLTRFSVGAGYLDTRTWRRPSAEGLLWSMVNKRRLAGYKFQRDRRVGDDVVPYYCETAKLAVDVERTSNPLRRKEEDMRDERLRKAGVRVIRIPEEIILQRPESARNTILEELPVEQT
ncbi:MAG: DUF559 domain-containing protein [Chitinivibrionales bacterium]|nr:DUF559 domain-containing protein [Chitinivibrionales bacterium]